MPSASKERQKGAKARQKSQRDQKEGTKGETKLEKVANVVKNMFREEEMRKHFRWKHNPTHHE